jgi:hypothetical protein
MDILFWVLGTPEQSKTPVPFFILQNTLNKLSVGFPVVFELVGNWQTSSRKWFWDFNCHES